MTPEQAPKEVWIFKPVCLEKDGTTSTLPYKVDTTETTHGTHYLRADRVELMVKLAVLEERSACLYGDNGYGHPYYTSIQKEIQSIKEQLQ